MASINIYINDSMKEEMASVEANWSEICRQAITMEISKIKGGEITYEPKNFDRGNWDYCSFEENFNNDNVIVKPYIDHADPKLRNMVKIASQWLEELKQELSIARLDGNSLGEFFQGVRKIEVLEPGKTWKTGYLKINYHIDFYFEDDTPIDAEIIEDLQISSSSKKTIKPVEIDRSLQLKELEHRGIINIDLKPLKTQEIPMMYPELYTPLKKALEENLFISKSDISAKKVKQWWKEWYDNELFKICGDTDIKTFLREEQRDADISGYIDNQYFERRIEFLLDVERNCAEIGFFEYDFTYFSSFIFDLFYFTNNQNFKDLNLNLFARINIQNKDELPYKSALYFIQENEQIYGFGFTNNLYEHWENHKLNKKINHHNNLEIIFLIIDSQRYLEKMAKELTPNYLEKITFENNPLLN